MDSSVPSTLPASSPECAPLSAATPEPASVAQSAQPSPAVQQRSLPVQSSAAPAQSTHTHPSAQPDTRMTAPPPVSPETASAPSGSQAAAGSTGPKLAFLSEDLSLAVRETRAVRMLLSVLLAYFIFSGQVEAAAAWISPVGVLVLSQVGQDDSLANDWALGVAGIKNQAAGCGLAPSRFLCTQCRDCGVCVHDRIGRCSTAHDRHGVWLQQPGSALTQDVGLATDN